MPDEQGVQRILLIDDSEDDRALVMEALRKGAPSRQYEFSEASDGFDGLQLCRESLETESVDCVILNTKLPGKTGLEILQELQDAAGVSSVPVILLSGFASEDEAAEALRLGAQEYVTQDVVLPSVFFRIVDNAIQRHTMVKRLHQSEHDAEAANQAKSDLIGRISHEIRTPMTAVLGLADLLLESDLDEGQRKHLEMIRDNGAYLVEIVNDLLDLSKMEAGMLEIEPQAVSIDELTASVLQLMQIRAVDNDVKLRRVLDSELPRHVMIDPVRLRQILFNLLGNAIKFAPGGNVTLEVKRVQREGELCLQFSVLDTGCGIKSEELPRIFKPFAQIESQGRQTGGTGLGLAICWRLASAMGGAIDVESEFGKGSEFSLALPLHVAKPQGESDDKRGILTRTVEEILEGVHVLVAEDTPATQVLIRCIIEAVGGRVTIVSDGSQLIQSIAELKPSPDIVVTDVQMPGIDGLTATRRIRDSNWIIPVMVLTADAYGETKESALASGANSVLTKPINRIEFLNSLAHLRELNEGPDHDPGTVGV